MNKGSASLWHPAVSLRAYDATYDRAKSLWENRLSPYGPLPGAYLEWSLFSLGFTQVTPSKS
jgi:hypothetical protein